MNGCSDHHVAPGLRRVIAGQVTLTAVLMAAFAWFGGLPDALGALYGGAVAAGSAWFGWSMVVGSTEAADYSITRRALYVGAIMRFVLVPLAFAIGLGLMELAAPPMVVVFAACQLGYLCAAGAGADRKTRS